MAYYSGNHIKPIFVHQCGAAQIFQWYYITKYSNNIKLSRSRYTNIYRSIDISIYRYIISFSFTLESIAIYKGFNWNHILSFMYPSPYSLCIMTHKRNWSFLTHWHSSFLQIISPLNNRCNKFALLWGEAQLCLPHVCL